MNLIPFLICFPFFAALIVFLIKDRRIRNIIVPVFVLAIMVLDGIVISNFLFVKDSASQALYLHTHEVDLVMMGVEVLLVVLVTILSIKHKKYFIGILQL